MDKLLNALRNGNIEQKLALFPQLLQHGGEGIDYLIDCLSDRQLAIRAKAYELLENVASLEAQQAIATGLLLNPGDRIYYIVKPSFWFNDSFYSVYQALDREQSKCLKTIENYQQQGYKFISFGESVYIITSAFHYINYQQAESAAQEINNQIISQYSITDFKINDSLENIKNWCIDYGILQAVEEFQQEKNIRIGMDKVSRYFGIAYDPNNVDKIYWSTVEEYLKSISNFQLLNQLWQDLIGNLTSIREISFAKPTYFKIDPYYSQLFDLTKVFGYSLGEDPQEFDNSEESEINFLLEALNHTKLEVRNLAYKLLSGIDSESAQQAISGGLKLNPGDRIYSVYRSGLWFNDEYYYLYDERYFDNYLNDLSRQIYKEQYEEIEEDEQEQRRKRQRIYLYIDKEQAEAKAEALHREMINKVGFGFGGFEWEKENPNFDAKQWCLTNNVNITSPYRQNINYDVYDWDIKEYAYKQEDDLLYDNWIRSKYIYHPYCIDTWCEDNDIKCDYDLDNWDNYHQVLDFLCLPENINLLSKFWKDGVGNFAFIKEEIVQDTIYLPVEKELKDLSKKERRRLDSFLKPNNYLELASKYLIDIIESDRGNAKQKLKAQELLQKLDLDTEETKRAIAKEIAIDSVFDLAESNNSEPTDEFTEYLLDDRPF